MSEWKKYLLRLAAKDKMCAPYRHALSECDSKEAAISLYKKDIDWALLNDYPTLKDLREEFVGYERNGIFIDHIFSGETFKQQQCYVLHHCFGEVAVDINLKEAIIPMIYLANGCKLTIRRANIENKYPITVPVYVFGENEVVAEDTSNISFRVYEKQLN